MEIDKIATFHSPFASRSPFRRTRRPVSRRGRQHHRHGSKKRGQQRHTGDGYSISLKQGAYRLSYYAIGWAGTPYIKCEVFDESNRNLGSQIIYCGNNVARA